jgi:hypothetical protein
MELEGETFDTRFGIASACSSHLQHNTSFFITTLMATAAVQINGSAMCSDDWPGRYFHVDQILDRPGPRTDPSFLAGDGVSVIVFAGCI